VDFNNNTVFLPGTKTESAPRWIPMSPELRSTLEKLKTEKNPAPADAVISISDARTCLETACRKLGFPKYTHHDFRHFFATTCIESGVDVPTVSRWLGHADGGALAMKQYGHLRQEHSLAMSKRVSFDKPGNVIPMVNVAETNAKVQTSTTPDERRAIANAKAKYGYPWWASENPLEVFWGQLNEETKIIPVEKFLEVARQAMGRAVLKSELADCEPLVDELSARISTTTLNEVRARTSAQNATGRKAAK
jgi:hypothetical protein